MCCELYKELREIGNVMSWSSADWSMEGRKLDHGLES